MTKLNKAETKTEFAARVGLTKGRVSQPVAEGLPVREDGTIDVEAGLAWMEKNLDPSRRNKGGAINTGFGSPSVAAETGADSQAIFAVLDRLMREHLEHLADTPLGNLADAG